MASNYYLADVGDTNKVFFDLDPSPIPILIPNRFGSRSRTITAWNGSTMLPGISYNDDQGTSLDACQVEITVPMLNYATYTAIRNKQFNLAMVWFYHEFDDAIYELCWQSGQQGLQLLNGTDRVYGQMRFWANRQVS